ncbi:hypothetical protein KC354_g33 [Hortaea werneckii]|nr:hypothetical protein KC354_g33 [Hortaea werneckii]
MESESDLGNHASPPPFSRQHQLLESSRKSSMAVSLIDAHDSQFFSGLSLQISGPDSSKTPYITSSPNAMLAYWATSTERLPARSPS